MSFRFVYENARLCAGTADKLVIYRRMASTENSIQSITTKEGINSNSQLMVYGAPHIYESVVEYKP